MQLSKMASFALLSGLLISCGSVGAAMWGRAVTTLRLAPVDRRASAEPEAEVHRTLRSKATVIDGANPTTDVVTTDAPIVMGTCTIGGGECPAGYDCGCGGPGPGLCECHKKCSSANDCGGSNPMCGCSAGDANKICVSACFCTCL